MEKIKKILLIDDSNAVNRRNESMLRARGLFDNILKYSNPKLAIESIKSEGNLPDIIFLDLQMPEMDGFNFLDQYIELEGVVETDYKPLIVIVSDHLGFENFDKSKYYKTYGVLEHIKKPVDKEDVLNLLEEHFEGFELP